jgi:AcrR family transcriptional regulator
MTTRGRPREFDLDEALDRALPLFWRDGYEGASVNEIAEAMGVSKPSLYAAFGDKESLYLRALSRYGERQRARHADILDAQPDARKAVEAFLLSVVDAHTDPALPGGCMVVSGTTTCDGSAVPESVKQALCEALKVGENTIGERLVRARREGQLAPSVDVTALATYFNTVLAGLSVQAKGQACREVLRGVVRSAMGAWPSG